MKKLKKPFSKRRLLAFTLVELMIVIGVIGTLAGLVSLSTVSIQKSSRDTARDANVKIISTALEKYYRDNGEYPSVAFMTSQSVNTIKQKLGIVSTSALKLPQTSSSAASSLVTSNPSPTRLLYSANTSDPTKNPQCQTDLNGYCDGFQLQYKKEFDGSIVIAKSIHDTFTPVAGTRTCQEGETQDGNTCTRTYAATYQNGTYSCPSGGTLSGSICTSTYAASYSSGGGYYYCPSGGSVSGSNCVTTSSYPASSYTTYNCGSGSPVSGANYPLCRYTYSASVNTVYSCPHVNDTGLSGSTCTHNRTAYDTSFKCTQAGYFWNNGTCTDWHPANTSTSYYCPNGGYLSGSSCISEYDGSPVTNYTCPSGGTLSGTNCVTSSSYAATYYSYPGYYYCSGSGTLSGTTCTTTSAASQSPGFYFCSDGGTVSGTTCTYSYTLPD